MTRAVALALLALSFGIASRGCGGAAAPAPAQSQPQTAALQDEPPPAPVVVAPAGSDAGAEPSQEQELLALVRDNVAATDMSALVKVTAARSEGPDGAPPPATGYVNHVYEVEIVAPIAGCGGRKRFTYAEMAEADLEPMEVGTVLFVSVCRGGKGRYFTPDVGYAVPRSELPESALADLIAGKRKAEGGACRE